MKKARSSPVLGGQLSLLYNLGAAGTLTDGQLLDQFLARTDPAASEAAFTVLVERHGAMVLRICRQLLDDPHDAHDAFQATFLVLVRKAGSIRHREAVGGWLFGIARRVAARAQAEAVRRRRHLQELFDNQPIARDDVEVATTVSAEPDYGPLIHEVERLPEQLRSPVVLHYFEGLSTEATAQRLGCPRGTVLSRLSRARGRIKERLEQQGISFAALIPAADGLNRWIPPATVPAGLAQATVRAASALGLAGAAIESVVPAAVATLSRGVARTQLVSHVRAGATLFVLAVVGVSIGLAATLNPDEPRRTTSAPDMASPPRGMVQPSTKPPIEEKSVAKPIVYSGRVVDPDGKPVAGAKLHLADYGYRAPTATSIPCNSDIEGRFRLTVTKRDLIGMEPDETWKGAKVVATAEGFGPGWIDAYEDSKVDPLQLTIHLARDDVPIEGRIVNLEGRPVPGATIRPVGISQPERGDLSAWIESCRHGNGGSSDLERAHLGQTIRAVGAGLTQQFTTDTQGRFAIRGIGRERLVHLLVSGPTIQTKRIGVMTRQSTPFNVTMARGSPNWGIDLYYGARFDHVAAPTKPVVGIVRDKDTNKPLPGVRIVCFRTAEFPVISHFWEIETTTDENGRYRLTGLPKGRGNMLMFLPGDGQPYLPSPQEVPDTPRLDPVTLDIGLKRGVVIEGKVTDKLTGAPLKSYVEYNVFEDNPHLAEAPGFGSWPRLGPRWPTRADGLFRVVGLPGRGLVSASYVGTGDRYPTAVLTNGLEKTFVRDLSVVPNRFQANVNAVSVIDVPEAATSIHCDLTLEKGITRILRVVAPTGEPISNALIWAPPWGAPRNSGHPGEYRMSGLRPRETLVVNAIHDVGKVAGTVTIDADGVGIVELKLQPWGTVIGRLVDEDGQPRPKVDLVDDRRQHAATTDSQGRFRVEGLIPGKEAELWVSPTPVGKRSRVAHVLLGANEVKDVGDVTETP